MKKLFLLLFAFSFVLIASAAPDIIEDIKENDTELKNPEVEKNSDFWFDRGTLFLDAYEANIKDYLPGMNAQTLKFTAGEPKKIEKDPKTQNETWYYDNVKLKFQGQTLVSVEDLKPLMEGALDKATEAFNKSMELYAKEEHGFFSSNNEEKSLEKLKPIADYYLKEGYSAYEKKDFASASASLENSLLIASKENYKKLNKITAVDTSLIYNVALTAKYASNFKKAVKYFSEAKKYNYGGADLYRLIGGCYKELKDTANAVKAYKEGFQKFVTNEALIVEMVNIYIAIQKSDEAIKYLDEGIKVNPTNASFYYAKGVLLNTLKKAEDAIATYKKAIELKPEYFEAYYNMGVIIYNQAVELQKEANLLPVNETKKYDEKIAQSDKKFLEAMPHFESAHKLDPKDASTMESLKNIYFRNRNKDPKIKAKYEEIMKKLK
jgi:tetratricopeptide (TPR) repeat protein